MQFFLQVKLIVTLCCHKPHLSICVKQSWKANETANKNDTFFCAHKTIVLSLVDLYLWEKPYLHNFFMLLLILHWRCFHEALIATDKDSMLSTAVTCKGRRGLTKCHSSKKSVLMTLACWFCAFWARIQILFFFNEL